MVQFNCACHKKRRLNVQKWSERGVFLAFWLRHLLRNATACTFFINRGAFSFLTSKSSSHHNGLQFSIAHPTTWLRTRRFGKHWKTSTFRPAATKHLKNIVLHDLSTFSHTLTFFLLTLSLLPLSLLTLSLLTLLFSDCSHHCCCICP